MSHCDTEAVVRLVELVLGDCRRSEFCKKMIPEYDVLQREARIAFEHDSCGMCAFVGFSTTCFVS